MDLKTQELAGLLPSYAIQVIDALEACGYEAWVVGGWVRDALRGAQGHDVDVTTDAPWQESERALQAAGMAVHRTGVAHGTVTAVCQGQPVEVTTYRVEGTYTDHRHPDEVRFVTDVREDLARRDLTINAMAFHPTRGLLDPFGGRDDLRRGLVRTVGRPQDRFSEDALRVLRAVRFSVRLGFSVEPATQEALRTCAPGLANVASERVGKELSAILAMGKAGPALMEQPEVMCAAIPELATARGFDQRSVYHVYDVYEHIAHVCCACEAFTAGQASEALRWAALLHDVGKPATYSVDVDGHGHFFNHPEEGARMARQILRRMGLRSGVVDAACALVLLHDRPLPKTARGIRKLLRTLGGLCPGQEGPLAFALFDLMRSDAVSKCRSSAAWASELDGYTRLLREELGRDTAWRASQLKVTGADVMRALDLAPGPAVGMYLDVLLAAVMEGTVPNDRDALLAYLNAGD